MSATRTLGRLPTLGEMKDYYARDDVLSFLYNECQMRNIDMALKRKRWPIEPTSKVHLREIIEKTTADRIERAYRSRSSGSVDNVRLDKFDYLSFHSRTTIVSGRKFIGFDTIFEADKQGWRRAFEDLVGVVSILDDFGVCYRIKYSGVRSLHFMIPFESLPKQFNGKPVISQRLEIQTKLQNYFRRRCGMEKAHGGGVMRLAYSLNEDNGLVSMPILSDELPFFRPWEANIYNAAMDKPWHGDIPAGASRNMLKFLREVYNEDAKGRKRKPRKIISSLEIAPKDRSNYEAGSGTFSIEECQARLGSDDESERLEAAWDLMVTPETVLVSVLEKGLADENPDVRWYLTEALQKTLDDDAVELAGKMLWDDDQFVRISAIDTLVLSGSNALQTILDSVSGDLRPSTGSINDGIYAIRKIYPEGEAEAARSFVGSIRKAVARSLLRTINSDQPFWTVYSYIRQLKALCKDYGIIESVLFQDTIEIIIPQTLEILSTGKVEYHQFWLLRQIRRNYAIPLMIMHEIANSLNIHDVKIPSNRMSEEEREFLTRVVRESLVGMTVEQKARILAAFWLHSRKKMSEPARELLMCIKQAYSSLAESITEWINSASVPFIGTEQNAAQDKSFDELIEMLGQGWRVRPVAIRVLAEKCETDEDIGGIIEALSDWNSKIRTGAVYALAAMPQHERARNAIREAVSAQIRTSNGRIFPRWDIRRAALKAYVRSNPPDAVDVLFHAIDEWRSSTGVHDAVAELRRYIDDERVQNKLRSIVANERFPRRARAKAGKVLQGVQGRQNP